jgi:exopolyphosphatase/guanosine-5'-triphosphate,3'-diphosphate pyrophosphatase
VSALAAILRLALALDRTHQQHVADVRASVGKQRVRITVESHGDTEVDLWAAERKVELFQKVFGREVCFAAGNSPSAAPRSGRPRRPRGTKLPRAESSSGAGPRAAANRKRPR